MKRNTGIIWLIAAVLVAFAAVVGGYVNDTYGDPCNDPSVRIMNVDESWDATNNSSSNYTSS